MDHVSGFTAKGLVYIPKEAYKKAGFSPKARVRVRAQKGRITLEEEPSLESMFGFLHTPGLNTGLSLEQILEKERKGVEEGFAEDYLSSKDNED